MDLGSVKLHSLAKSMGTMNVEQVERMNIMEHLSNSDAVA